MSDFSLTLVLQIKTSKNHQWHGKDKHEVWENHSFRRNISREGAFSRFVSPVIDKVLGLRCTSFGYQSARLWVLCQVSTSVAATVWRMWRTIWCPISRFIPLFARAALTQFSGESLSWAAPTRPILLTRERTTISIQLQDWTVCWWRCSWTQSSSWQERLTTLTSTTSS